jgi:MFS family permease
LANARAVDVAAAAERIRVAAAVLEQARALWLPTITVGGDYNRHDGKVQDSSGNISDNSLSSVMFGLGTGIGTAAIFSPNDAMFAKLVARQQLRARQADLQAVSNDTLVAVTDAYFTVQQARGELAGAVEATRRTEEIVEQTKKLVPSGLVPELETDRAEAELARRQQAELAARERWRVASTAWPGVLAARSLDRFGTGTRSAPRDALIAASADEGHRGKAFGLEGVGDNLGAFLGPLVAVALLTLAHVSLRSILLLAVIPGSLAAVMVLCVREQPVAVAAKAKLDLNVRRFPRGYWTYLGVTVLFGIGNSSNSFLILQTQDLGASLTVTILIYALFNLVAALASYPAGYLSDRLGRKGVLLLSFLVFSAVYLGFGLTANVVLIGALFVLYGVYQGVFRSVGKALASDFVPAEWRAGGVGWYTAAVGLSGLVASVVGGELWTRVGPSATFLYGAGFALLGSIALVLLVPQKHGE